MDKEGGPSLKNKTKLLLKENQQVFFFLFRSDCYYYDFGSVQGRAKAFALQEGTFSTITRASYLPGAGIFQHILLLLYSIGVIYSAGRAEMQNV